MLAPATLAEFARAPVGRYVAGRAWIHFHASRALFGFVLWGDARRTDLEDAARAWERGRAAMRERQSCVIDARGLDVVDPGAFEFTVEYHAAHRDALAAAIDRIAIVRAPSVIGAIAEGYARVVPVPYPVDVFVDPAEASRWLGHAEATRVLDELRDAVAVVSGTPQLLRELRAHVARHVREATLASTATALGVSARSLQRHLRALGTTFQDELSAARIDRARKLLAESDAKLAEIAAEVGCASANHLNVLFRKRTSESPSRWRAEQRRRGGS